MADPVQPIWVIPVAQPELDLARNEGFRAVWDVFEERDLALVLDERRASLV